MLALVCTKQLQGLFYVPPLLRLHPLTQDLTSALADISIQLTAIGVPGTASLALAREAPEFNPSNAIFAQIASGAANKPLTARMLTSDALYRARYHLRAAMSIRKHHNCNQLRMAPMKPNRRWLLGAPVTCGTLIQHPG